MKFEVKRNRLGYNCSCEVCGKEQSGQKAQPFIVWIKKDYEKRGHNIPVCSWECAEKLVERTKGE